VAAVRTENVSVARYTKRESLRLMAAKWRRNGKISGLKKRPSKIKVNMSQLEENLCGVLGQIIN
jgi:hypothetical protein